ncbi:helix-turn-helix transcriptional regulator [Sphingobacterium hotanense]|nr:helix-turn-helix transcriptional regulator [Sphingobacterium hotanense]
MTQSDLAASIGYKDFQSLARIENGRVTTSIYTIYLIAKGLNCSIDELTSDV